MNPIISFFKKIVCEHDYTLIGFNSIKCEKCQKIKYNPSHKKQNYNNGFLLNLKCFFRSTWTEKEITKALFKKYDKPKPAPIRTCDCELPTKLMVNINEPNNKINKAKLCTNCITYEILIGNLVEIL